MMEASKSEFIGKAASSGTSSKAFYKAVKSLTLADSPQPWSLLDLFPNRSVEDASAETAAYFTKITDTFIPLRPQHDDTAARRESVSLDLVRKKMMEANKPSSVVDGDVLPRLVKAHHHLLSIPATIIFNSVFATGQWPTKWKTETTVVIPKSTNPESMAECRNISCTPFLSKVLESIMLDDLRREIGLEPIWGYQKLLRGPSNGRLARESAITP